MSSPPSDASATRFPSCETLKLKFSAPGGRGQPEASKGLPPRVRRITADAKAEAGGEEAGGEEAGAAGGGGENCCTATGESCIDARGAAAWSVAGASASAMHRRWSSRLTSARLRSATHRAAQTSSRSAELSSPRSSAHSAEVGRQPRMSTAQRSSHACRGHARPSQLSSSTLCTEPIPSVDKVRWSNTCTVGSYTVPRRQTKARP